MSTYTIRVPPHPHRLNTSPPVQVSKNAAEAITIGLSDIYYAKCISFAKDTSEKLNEEEEKKRINSVLAHQKREWRENYHTRLSLFEKMQCSYDPTMATLKSGMAAKLSKDEYETRKKIFNYVQEQAKWFLGPNWEAQAAKLKAEKAELEERDCTEEAVVNPLTRDTGEQHIIEMLRKRLRTAARTPEGFRQYDGYNHKEETFRSLECAYIRKGQIRRF